ncbi:AfsR/SARP family transcriptional regulator [Denitrobaculum tricleocarpae]|uniref:Bacterial transcriptional activator domain-containing protein n=1 Tax=Denitrobaculum tricleocarpae TaxID=2591009 RepID=A0A545TML8_9PROT|nr:BTAD domain-containing putative transcriptional regulator [Denitrobaculum tricleocarpae]TQV78454.1 hypothetical protein FKG95_17990 [Denitrobaculum tricleocarpae]
MADLKLLILGRVRLETNDGECVGRLGAKAKGLLAYLAAQPHGRADREVLANLLWDACPQTEARHSLRQALLTLRTRLGDYSDRVLTSDRESLQLRLDLVDVDMRRFEVAVLSADDEALVQVCRLWRGPFCEGLDVGADLFEDWLLRERARLDELAVAGFRRAAKQQLSAGCFAAAVDAAQRCVALNPFDDSAHAYLIDLYGQRGWIGSARNAYRRCVDLFRRELGEGPDEAVQAAMARALERRDHQADRRPTFECPKVAAPALSLPGARLRKPASVLNASVMALSAFTVLSVMISIGAFVRDEVRGPATSTSDQTGASIAWVGRGIAETYPRAQSAVLSSRPAEISAVGDARQITTREAISRALQLDSDYAYLYPAGC